MPNQKPLHFKEHSKSDDHSTSPMFTAPVKVDTPEFDYLISAIARDAEGLGVLVAKLALIMPWI